MIVSLKVSFVCCEVIMFWFLIFCLWLYRFVLGVLLSVLFFVVIFCFLLSEGKCLLDSGGGDLIELIILLVGKDEEYIMLE